MTEHLKAGMPEKITVPASKGLDPVYAYFDDIGDGQGRVILVCWDMAYTAYWGAMGNRTIKQFFAECGTDYIENNMQGRHYKRGSVDNSYLSRIIKAVHQHLHSADLVEKVKVKE